MPKPFLKVLHIIISHNCQTPVTVAFNVKEHLNAFRRWVYGKWYSTTILPLEERKIGRSKNRNLCKPQAIIKSCNELNFIFLIMDPSLIVILINHFNLIKYFKNRIAWCLITKFYHPVDCSPPSSSVHEISQARIGVGCHFLSQRVFPIQGWNPRLLLW